MSCLTSYSTSLRSKLVLACCSLAPLPLLAQNPNVAPADLEYTRAAFTHNHLIAQVKLRVKESKYIRYRYDRYPDLARIKTDGEVAYAKPKTKAWLKSDDWGETGTQVKADKAHELDKDTQIAELPWYEVETLDKTQGDIVWKLVDRTKKGNCEYFTYERSRERPRPGGFYPRYTFVKNKNDSDGRLLLSHFSGQLRTDGGAIPIEVQFDLMIQLPPGSVRFKIASPSKMDGGKHQ